MKGLKFTFKSVCFIFIALIIFVSWNTKLDRSGETAPAAPAIAVINNVTLYFKLASKVVTGVIIDKNTGVLKVGESIILKATVNPTDALNQNVTWSSSNASAAQVDNAGKVTAVSIGTATITVTTSDGKFKASCNITVIQAPPVNAPSAPVKAPPAPINLQAQPIPYSPDLPLDTNIKNYLGSGINKVGFIYYDLTTGEKISINGNKICTAASTYKVGMNMVAYSWVRGSKLSLSEDLIYNSTYFEAGTGILQYQLSTTLQNPIKVQKLLDYSIIYSDNIAARMILGRLGGGQAVRQAICNMAGINIDTSKNVVTPEIEFRLLKELYENGNDQYYSHLISIMKQTKFHDRIDKYIPQNIVAHKIGNYGTYVNDVGIVYTDKPYIFVMYVDGLNNSAEKIANVSKMVYEAQLKK